MKKVNQFIVWQLLIFLSLPAFSQWSTNPATNSPVCTNTGDQLSPHIVTDGAGGAIVAWYDYSTGWPTIYAQSINASGVDQWANNGVHVPSLAGYQKDLAMIADGAGGAFFAWIDSASALYTLRVQRLSSAGAVQWASGGIGISAATNIMSSASLVSDGAGGIIVAWCDNRIATDSAQLYMQRIDGAGTIQWSASGKQIGTLGTKYEPVIVTDGSGGAIATWQDSRSGSIDIYSQRVNSSGTQQWANNGVPVCTTHSFGYNLQAISNGQGGVAICWADIRSGNSDIYAQVVNLSGIMQGTINGVAICTAAYNQDNPVLTSDASGGAIITWIDSRSNGNYDIYAQRINAACNIQWTSNGVPVCTNSNVGTLVSIDGDGAGGAMIAWYGGGTNAPGIYVQHLLPSGLGQWMANGSAISTGSSYQWFPSILSNGTGSPIIAWADNRNYNTSLTDIYIQGGLRPDGTICSTAPAAPGNISGASPVCPQAVYVYSVAPVPGALSYNWTTLGGWSGTSLTNTISVRVSTASGTISVQASNGCGLSQASSFAVTTKPLPDSTVTVADPVMTANLSGAAYQWIFCYGEANAPGASTSQSYTATVNSYYRLIVTGNNGCSDTSGCLNIITAGISELNAAQHLITVYPNPSEGAFTVQSWREGDYEVVNALGCIVSSFRLSASNNYAADIKIAGQGIYFVRETNNRGGPPKKLIISR